MSSPLIWFLLLDSATGEPYRGTTVSSIVRSSLVFPVVDQFRDAVQLKYDKPNYLKDIPSGALIVYKNKAAFEKRNVDDGKEEPLKSSRSLDGLGTTEEEALIVVVPSLNISSKLVRIEQEIKALENSEEFKTLAIKNRAWAYLTGLQNKEKELLQRESQLTSTSDVKMPEMPPEGSSERRKVDDLIEKSKKYLFRTETWGCVTVFKRRKAVTFAHNEHSALQPGMTIKIYSIEGNVECDAKVVKTNAESDWVLLETDIDLCEDEPKKGLTVDGREYIQLGLSATTQQDSPFSTSKGVISSSRLNKFGHLLGSAGANPGDSGGPCFNESNGELIGMNVGCESVPFNPDMDTVTQTFHKISSRFASRAHIIPVGSFQFV